MTGDKRQTNLQQIKARQARYKAMGLCNCGRIPTLGYKDYASCRQTRKARLQRYREVGESAGKYRLDLVGVLEGGFQPLPRRRVRFTRL